MSGLAQMGLHTVTEEELPSLSETLAAAFFDDPVDSWCIPDPDRRRALQAKMFGLIIETYRPYGETYVVEGAVSGAVWAPPGIHDDGEQLMSELIALSGEDARRLVEVFTLMDENHPRDPHHYLFLLGTRPGLQSRGLGSAVMRPVLEICDRDGVPAYLEATSERNRALYLRHGFEVTGEIRLPDGPSMWPMWRTPR